MKSNTIMQFVLEDMDFCVTDKLLKIEELCYSLLKRLTPVLDMEHFRREAEYSVSSACTSDDADKLQDICVRVNSRINAASLIQRESSMDLETIQSVFETVCGGHYHLTEDNTKDLTSLLYAMDVKEFEEHTLLKAVFLHNAIIRLNIFPHYNTAMADLLIYLVMQKEYPMFWNCHPSFVSSKDWMTEYHRIVANHSATEAMECYATLLYRSICFALVKQEVNDESKYSRSELAVFLRRRDDVDYFIKEVLHVCS